MDGYSEESLNQIVQVSTLRVTRPLKNPTMDQIIGHNAIKEMIYDLVIRPIQERQETKEYDPLKPAVFSRIPTILLHGLGGNGKTMIAQAIVSELQIAYSHLGIGCSHFSYKDARVCDIFHQAKLSHPDPTLIILDDIDMISKVERFKIRQAMSKYLDKHNYNIIVIALTRTRILENRTLAHFEYVLPINLPNEIEREDYVNHFLTQTGQQLSTDLIKAFIGKSKGYSYQKINYILESTTKVAQREESTLQFSHFKTVIDRIANINLRNKDHRKQLKKLVKPTEGIPKEIKTEILNDIKRRRSHNVKKMITPRDKLWKKLEKSINKSNRH